MSVEAPTAPRTPESSPLDGLSTDELLAELKRRGLETSTEEASTEDTSADTPPSYTSWDRFDFSPDSPSSTIDAPLSYFGEDDPVKEEDERNRAIDHEILGKAVRVRHDISAKGAEAASKVDRLLAQTANLVGKPREMIRKWHMNRAEKSLKKKENRLENKMQKWQASLDNASSERLYKRRLEKAQKAARKEQRKVDAYSANHVEHRRARYDESVATRTGRLEKSDNRRSERQDSAAEARRGAIDRKATALGKKELKKELRGSENRAGILETRRIMKEVLGEESSQQKLRQLGRTVVGRQLSETRLNRNIYEKGSTTEAAARLSDLVAKEQSQQKSIGTRIEMAKRDYALVSRVLGGETGGSAALPELELFKDDDAMFTREGLREITDRIKEEEEQLENSKRHARELEAQLRSAHERLLEQQTQLLKSERASARERSSANIQTKDMLN